MLVVVYLEGGASGEWRDRLQRCLPGIPCRTLNEDTPAGSVTHAAVWHPPPGLLASFPGLRSVVSLAAGVGRHPERLDVSLGSPNSRIGRRAAGSQHAGMCSARCTGASQGLAAHTLRPPESDLERSGAPDGHRAHRRRDGVATFAVCEYL